MSYQLIDGNDRIKAWIGGVPVEHQALQQLRNIASLPFVHSHVAVMPDVHLGVGATVGSVIPTEGAIIPAAVGVDIGCFSGDTKVPLLDGTQSTMISLAERDAPFWVYSLNSEMQVVPGHARCLKTRENAELMRVVVSGGDEIICTPDHPFMLTNGTFRLAAELLFNDSLMPLYRRWQTRDGYESVSDGFRGFKQTHVMVWEHANQRQVPPGHVVHHRNHIQFDNRPENLEVMDSRAHSSYHRKVGRSFNNADPLFQKLRRAGITRRRSDPEKLQQMIDIGTVNITAYMRENPEHYAEATSGNGERGAPYLRTFNTSPRRCNDCGVEMENPAALRWHGVREHGHNHKVILTQPVDVRLDVYCLQVDEHHNFALAAGVFVHNCGMNAIRTSLTSHQLPDNLKLVRDAIEAAVPVGFNDHGDNTPAVISSLWNNTLSRDLKGLQGQHPGIETKRHPACQIGTLGGGNHFIELCLDEEDRVWIMLHSGSRGIGNRIGNYFITLAKEDMLRHGVTLTDKNLAYFKEGSPNFADYVEAVLWAQTYASTNRSMMMSAVIGAVWESLTRFDWGDMVVSCHHNYVANEHHFGADVWLTRKGAVRAGKGDLGIIPGSMGARSYIVCGKGNPDSFCSCSHGAGRAMSRSAAKKAFTVADLAAATAGVECRKDQGVLDEAPGAYKDIDAVMAAQSDLVEVVHTLKQVLCVKG